MDNDIQLVKITYSETINGATYSASTYVADTHAMPAYETLKQVVSRQTAYEEKKREEAISGLAKDQEWFEGISGREWCAKPPQQEF